MSAPVWVLRMPAVAPRYPVQSGRGPLYWSEFADEWQPNRALATRCPTYSDAAEVLANVVAPDDARIVRLVRKETAKC